MKVIIAGAGKVGGLVAKTLADEGHDITIIDSDTDIIDHISNEVDAICIEGSATNPDILIQADAEDADLIFSATQLDEINMISGISAKRLGTKNVIARVRDTEYLNKTEFLRNALGLDLTVNPEYECSLEISRILSFPSSAHVNTFSHGKVDLVEHKIRNGGRLSEMPLYELHNASGAEVIVCLVERDNEVFIPNGSFVFHEGDRLSIAGTPKELRKFYAFTGEYKKRVHSVMILGGGRTSVYLAKLLVGEGMRVSVVELDDERCEELGEDLEGCTIICGDGTNKDVLLEEGIKNVDAFVALTGDDGDNIVTSIYAKSIGVDTVITKINRRHFTEIMSSSTIDSVVSPKEVAVDQIIRYVRALAASSQGSMEALYKLGDGSAEALEFTVGESAEYTNIPLKDMKIKDNTLIAAIVRGNKAILPDGNSEIKVGDHVVVICKSSKIKNLEDILQ